MSSRGLRGYIASRPVAGARVPQHVQNLVIRDYARRKGQELKTIERWLAPNLGYDRDTNGAREASATTAKRIQWRKT